MTPHPGLPPPARSGWRREEEAQGSGCSFRQRAETKRSVLCADDTMQEQGVSKILTINLNDMAKELEIE